MKTEHFEFLRNETILRDPEIVRWYSAITGETTRYTLLWYRKDKEGYHIEFVGDRPLQEEHQDELFEIMRYGQTVLGAEVRLLERIGD